MRDYTARPIPDSEKLKDWFGREKNVLLISDHGMGKTAIITDFCYKNNIKFAMFSGSTLDPWTDLIGIPRPIKNKSGYVIEYVRPQTVPDDIELFFIDEINRSHPKVRNALMELIQFKSINGKKFEKLRVVWGAANPPDSELAYDVEDLDPAQEDRFHVIYKIRRALNMEYLVGKYGEFLAERVDQWWRNLGDELKKTISPRRVDYILQEFVDGGDLRDLLPYEGAQVSTLIRELDNNPHRQEFEKIFAEKDKKALKAFIEDAEKWQSCKRFILEDYNMAKFVLPAIPKEELVANSVQFSGLAMLAASESESDTTIRKTLNTLREGGTPEWLSRAQLLSQHLNIPQEFITQFNAINVDNLDSVSLPKAAQDLSLKSVDEILEDLPNYLGDFVNMDEQSALNYLEFVRGAIKLQKYNYTKDSEDERIQNNHKKFKDFLNSALLRVYLNYGNFGIVFYYFSDLVNIINPNLLSSSVPQRQKTSNPFGRPVTRSGRRSRNNPVREETL